MSKADLMHIKAVQLLEELGSKWDGEDWSRPSLPTYKQLGAAADILHDLLRNRARVLHGSTADSVEASELETTERALQTYVRVRWPSWGM